MASKWVVITELGSGQKTVQGFDTKRAAREAAKAGRAQGQFASVFERSFAEQFGLLPVGK